MLEKLQKYSDTILATKELGNDFFWQNLIETGEKMPEFPQNEMVDRNRVNELHLSSLLTKILPFLPTKSFAKRNLFSSNDSQLESL